MTLSCKARPEAGFTLVEVCIAALIVAMGASAIFGIVLSVRQSIATSPAREQMHQYARQVSEDLKAYVTQNTDSTVGRPNLGWRYPNDSSGLAALDPGTHDVSSMLPPALASTYKAHLTYTVTTPGGAAPTKVDVTMTWTEPD